MLRVPAALKQLNIDVDCDRPRTGLRGAPHRTPPTSPLLPRGSALEATSAAAKPALTHSPEQRSPQEHRSCRYVAQVAHAGGTLARADEHADHMACRHEPPALPLHEREHDGARLPDRAAKICGPGLVFERATAVCRVKLNSFLRADAWPVTLMYGRGQPRLQCAEQGRPRPCRRREELAQEADS